MIITLAHMPISLSIAENLAQVEKILSDTKQSDIVVFAEGALSGYTPEDKDFIKNLDFNALDNAHETCRRLAREKKMHLLIGSIDSEGSKHYNTSFLFCPDGTTQRYRKANLAFLDKKHFAAGDALPQFIINSTKTAILMCREAMFPEMWRLHAINGAKILFHLDNSRGREKYDLWKSIFAPLMA